MILPDITHLPRIEPDAPGQRYTQLVSCAFECKYKSSDKYGNYFATCRHGLAQDSLYRSLAFEMSGTWLGGAFVNTSFTRVCALDVKEFLIELDLNPEFTPELSAELSSIDTIPAGFTIAEILALAPTMTVRDLLTED